MLKLLATIVFIFALCFSVFSQYEKYTVPAKWGFYTVKDKKVSFLMPRLPILLKSGDWCRGEIIEDYSAYTDGAAYTVRIVSKIVPPKYCTASVRKDFGEQNFIERLNQLKQNLTQESGSVNDISKDSVIKLIGKDKIIKLINDYDNERWFEFAVHSADESKADAKNFLSSLKNAAQADGIEIGQGAEQVFGDDASASLTDVKTIGDDGKESVSKQILIKIDDKTNRGITFITKPAARYTDAARQNNVQGRVVLRITFLANGAIGNIVVVSGLEYGLTEQAIAAARKMVFIPAQGNGFRFTLTKSVEYSFTLI